MKSILIIICILSITASCEKTGNSVTKPSDKSSHYTDSLKMEEAIKATMQKMNL